jgi:hypothetical protein
MPSLSLAARAVVPVMMLAGGGVAWASAAEPTVTTSAERAWIDSPTTGEQLAPGDLVVRAHASAPGGVQRIELDVDGRKEAGESAGSDDRLGVVTLHLKATAGVHVLRVRGESGEGWGPYSAPVTVQVGDPSAVTTTTLPTTTTTTGIVGMTTSVPDSSTTSSTTAVTTSTIVTTTLPGTPRTTASPSTTATPRVTVTSAPTTTGAPGTTAPPTTTLPPPTVSVSGPSTQFVGLPATFTATGSASGRPFALSISVQSTPGGSLVQIASCTSSPCTVNRTFNSTGNYQYVATITVSGVAPVTSATRSILIKLIG